MTLLRYLPRFRAAYRALPDLERREGWPRAELEAFQLARLNEVWRHAVRYVPVYRQLARQRRLPDHFDSLPEFQAIVPLADFDLLRQTPEAFLSERAERGCWNLTGGTTGTPRRTYRGRRAHCENLRGRYRFLARWGIDIFDPCVFFWGHAHGRPGGWKEWLAEIGKAAGDWLRNRRRLSAYQLHRDDLRRHLDRIATYRPRWLYAYSRAAELLATEAVQVGFSCDSLKLVVLTAEPLTPPLAATVERGFGVPAVAEYGSVECGFLAGEGPDRLLRVREDQVLVETLPRPDGRCDVVLTVLSNPSFPLIRYPIGDVVDAPLTRPERGMGWLTGVVGRVNDLLRSRSGRWIHPSRVDSLFRVAPELYRRYQVRQAADGSVCVAAELRGAGGAAALAAVARGLVEWLDGYPVRVEAVDHIPLTAAGKHRVIASELDTPGPASGST